MIVRQEIEAAGLGQEIWQFFAVLLPVQTTGVMGDGRTYDGDLVSQQPMILPLFDGISEIEALGRLVGEANADGYSLVYATFQSLQGSPGKRAFDKYLSDGFVSGGYPTQNSNISGPALAELLGAYQAPPAPI